MRCTTGTARIPTTMMPRIPKISLPLSGVGITPSARITGPPAMRVEMSSAKIRMPSTTFNFIENAEHCSRYGQRPGGSFQWRCH